MIRQVVTGKGKRRLMKWEDNKMIEMEKTYSPAGIEEKQYERWEKKGYFHADGKSDKPK